MPLSLATALIPELLTTGLGIYQGIMGNKFGNVTRPVKKIPQSKTDALNLQKGLATSRNAPGYNDAVEGIDLGFNEALDVGRRTGNIDVGTAYRNKTSAIAQLGTADAAFQERNMNNLVGEMDRYGDEQDEAWDYNVNQPFQEQVQVSNELKNASVTNILNSFTDTSGMLLGKMGLDSFESIMRSGQKIYDRGQPNNTLRTPRVAAGGKVPVQRASSPTMSREGLDIESLIELLIEDPTALRQSVKGY